MRRSTRSPALRGPGGRATHCPRTSRQLAPLLEALERRTVLSTIVTVDTTSDVLDGDTSSIAALQANAGSDGRISLREAVMAANQTANGPDPDEIRFDVPGPGPHSIQPSSALPVVTDPVIIDGYTQPGASRATEAARAEIAIELDGRLLPGYGAGNGLVISAGGTTVRGLAINRFADSGILVHTNGGTTIEGNYIGTDPTGTLGLGNKTGVEVLSGTNLIGVDGASGIGVGGRNVISGNTQSNLLVRGDGNRISGNYIGTDPAGASAIPGSGNGIAILNATSNIVGTNGDGLGDGAEGNLISGNGTGLSITGIGADGNLVAGNVIGTDATGLVAIGNGGDAAVHIRAGAKSNRVGTNGDGISDTLERNLISGNFGVGVNLRDAGTDFNVVAGNYIGVDLTGNSAIPNAVHGITVNLGAGPTLIGTDGNGVADDIEGNVISGNGSAGLWLDSSEVTLAGNLIGTNADGTAAVPNLNGQHAVALMGDRSRIGTNGDGISDDLEGNVISGNIGIGLLVWGDQNIVAGNLIGTDGSGTEVIGNTHDGVAVIAGQSNRVGTDGDGLSDALEANVIGGNQSSGLSLGNGTSGTLVAGNYIGTDRSGTLDLGNQAHGIVATSLDGTTATVIGGAPGLGNVIAYNGGVGIAAAGQPTTIRANSIHSNGLLGIDVGGSGSPGVTPNDPGDTDAWLQNYPVLGSATSSGASTTIVGTLNSTPGASFTIEFFANQVADPSGHGEGEVYLDALTVTTGGDGNADFSATFPVVVAGGHFITATATDSSGSTSEFSAVMQVVQTNQLPTISAQAFSVDENQTAVGLVAASDPDLPDDTLTYAIDGGPDADRFAIDGTTGLLTFRDAPDYEMPIDADSDNVYEVRISVTDTSAASAAADVTVNVLNLASISGTVFVDVNANGVYEANEPGIDGVSIELLDASGNPILGPAGSPLTATTSSGGFYLFDDLEPGTYRLFEHHPTGVADGPEALGSLGGTLVDNDLMQLTLGREEATDYIFAELGGGLSSGDTATIGFWHNKHGQELITSGGTALVDWLTGTFGNVFGNTFIDGIGSDDGAEVAAFFRDQLFKQKSKMSAGPAKVDAQFLATALATFFTSSNLAGGVASSYGFHVTDTGIGTRLVDVGTGGAAFDADDGTVFTILQLLVATDVLTDNDPSSPDEILGFAHIYDRNGDGVIDADEAALRDMANAVYAAINEGGDIG